MADDLGSDFSCGLDLDPALRIASNERALADAITRRLNTPLGAFEDYPHYGYDISQLIGRVVVPSQIQQGVLAQCRAEEEVAEARVTVTQDDRLVSLLISLQTSFGPFEFTVEVSDLGVAAIIPTGN